MSSSIIRGKYLISSVNEQAVPNILTNGAIFQRHGEIIDIGDYPSIKRRHDADEEIGSGSHIVLPGLVNAHQHGRGLSYMLRGVPDDRLEPWLVDLIGQRSIDPYLDIRYCTARLIESGVTTVMHSHHPRSHDYEAEVASILKAYQDAGVRVAFALGIADQNNLVYQEDADFIRSIPLDLSARVKGLLDGIRLSEENYFDTFAKLQEKYGDRAVPSVRILHGPIGLPWCSDRLLGRIKSSSEEFRSGIHTHLAETRYQASYDLKRFGKTAVKHLRDLGLLGPATSLAHCVWVTEEDIRILADEGVTVCHNPGSNLRLGSGIAPIPLMRRWDVPVALGTDNLSMNDDEDLLQDLRLCSHLYRGNGLAPTELSCGELLRMATVHGARATLFGEMIGTLEKGKRADAVLIKFPERLERFAESEAEVLSLLMSGIRGRSVDTVLVDGEVLYEGGRHRRVNKDEVEAALLGSIGGPLQGDEAARKSLAKALRPYIVSFYKDWTEKDPSHGRR
jgi:5-methylthioadenosine/S-adenosylhomocysteine deaminase